LFVAACGGSPTGPTGPAPTATLTPVAQTAEWPASTLEAEHLDRARLSDLALRIRRGDYGRVASVLVARNGRLVLEEYFNGWPPEQAHTMQSVTKSVVSLLTGIAVSSGRMSIDDPVARFFPSYDPIANFDDRKAALTVRNLLTMRTGLDWSEDPYAGSPLQRLNDCRCDWIRFVLDWRMREQPGTRWEYVSGGVILLGAAIGAATSASIVLRARSCSIRSARPAFRGRRDYPTVCRTVAADCFSDRETPPSSERSCSTRAAGRGGRSSMRAGFRTARCAWTAGCACGRGARSITDRSGG